MQYLIDSYVAIFEDGNLFDKPTEIVNWLFVDVPFFLLRMVTSVFLFIEDLSNQSSFFEGMRTTVFNMSKNILNGFGGSNVKSGSLLALAITVSAFYLMYYFFFSRRSFLKVFLHYLAVIALFGLWFGNVETNNGKTYTGATFVVNTVSNFVDSIQSKFISGGSLASSGGSSGENGEGIYQSAIFDATVGQTFNFVNSGSLDGKMENGKKLDKDKLLRKIGESKEDWEKDRNKFVKKNKDNPYFELKMSKTMEKSFAIGVGFVNLFVLAVPLTYINFLLTLVELGANLLILIFPLIVLLSLFPRCQMVMFKFFKMLLGVLFLPALYGIFMSVLLWINGLIDSLFVNAIGKISSGLLLVLSGSVITLGTLLVTVLLKIFVYRKLWKNRYKVLEFFTDGQLKEPSFEKKVSEKVEKVEERALELGHGAIKTYVGTTTGNIGMAVDGINKIMSEQDKALNLSDSRFEEETGAVEPFDEENEEMLEMEDVLEDGLEDGEAFDELEEEEELEDSALLDEMDAFDEEPEDSALLDETEAFDEIPEEVSVEDLDKSLEEMDMPVLDEQEIQLTDDELDVDALVEGELEAMENVQADEANIDNLMETESPELIDSMNVTVDNFDELAFAREERAYFDHGGDEELINNYTGSEQSNVVSFYQTEENFYNLEQMEEEFFGSRLSGVEDVEEGW
ncbi:hypothetical protein PSN82_002508 [Enterococcus faecalis]|uniref:hypothetical protein n=1 Tax=Enterococcus faecalis TaxID=1351 RepID=UPI00287180CE|nr:hypothetical protein [Enterococcus faecalis]EJG4482796.1 hypothetical protein [Enterococcus faecalis]EKL7558882.1 hypothetical protein [Enterococcus faecalis]MDR9789061.1 hypothetical protein [Enterococcus faecalis]